jgi:hypothetical protein
MSARHSLRIAPWLGLAAGLWAFVGIAVPSAQAATPTMTTDLVSTVGEFAAGLSQIGIACVHSLDGLGLAFGFDPHGGGGSAAACPELQGIGLTFMGLLAVVAVALGRMRLQTEQRRLEVVRRLVEQGLTPPTPLLEGPSRHDRRKGIVLLSAGAGLLAAGTLLGDRGIAAGGLVPAFIGIGYLISHRLATAPPSEAS